MATTWPKETLDTIELLKGIQTDLCDRFVARDWAIRLLVLAAVCREHVLLVGPPGTAKTELVTRFAERIEARQFSYLLTRFTEPSELFGPLDLERFNEGSYEIRTDGMLPKADVAFLDEVFEGSSAILNTLLTLVNERVFYNGANPQRTDLVSVIGASNALPDDAALAAFADRFMLRIQVESVANTHLSDLVDIGGPQELERLTQLVTGRKASRPIAGVIALDALKALSRRLAEVDLTQVRPMYEDVVREIAAHGAHLSDRRIVKGLKLVAGAAVLDKATVAGARHLWPLNYFWTSLADANQVQAIVQPRVEEDGGQTIQRRREVDEILVDASVEVEHFRGRMEHATDASLVSTLQKLNGYRIELLRCHPGADDAMAALDEAISEIMERFGAAGGVA